LSGDEKEYEAVIRFGYSTDTGDMTGKPKSEVSSSNSWTDEEIEAALDRLRGARTQVPPMYSAKKVQGRKLYELARRGEEIERAAVPITIQEFEAVRAEGGQLLKQNADGTCDLCVRVVCSAGTYIRVLAEEVGAHLGTGAHLTQLRRTRAGQFRIEAATPLDELQETGAAPDILLPPDAALSFMPFVHLSVGEAQRASQGIALRLKAAEAADFSDGAFVRLRDERGSLVAVGAYEAETHSLHPRIVIAS
jgi:tRNA pseudouridine55 synthase